MNSTVLRNARTHNLKGVSLELASGEFVAVTGVSGAGKSSLCLDTLYAEGQRRFVESFSPYARQFLERHERPPIDQLEPVPAAVAVDRRAPVKSSRSTVATMADVEPYLSALFLREARPVCPDCHAPAVWTDAGSAARDTIGASSGERASIVFPRRVDGTASYLDARDELLRDGYRRLWVGDSIADIDAVRPSDVLEVGGRFDVVVDRIRLTQSSERRLQEALEQAWQRANGVAVVLPEGAARRELRRGLVCPSCARSFEPPRPGLFSYQSAVGACPTCKGFGRVIGIDFRKVFPDPSKSLAKGAIRPWSGKSATWERRVLKLFCEREGIDLQRPWGELTEEQRQAVIVGEGTWRRKKYPGIRAGFRYLESKAYKMHVRVLLSRYRSYDPCPACDGKRLNPTALSYQVDELDLAAWHGLELRDARDRLARLSTANGQGELVRKELATRLGFLCDVGLGYLTLDRQARTLSGGEAQRVSLTAALGASLTGALVVLDEPTVGLHAADVPPLVRAMRSLADQGNTVVVVEHEPPVVRAADRVLELGPGAGHEGGSLLFDGTPSALAKRRDLPTGRALAAAAPSPSTTRRKPKAWLRVDKAAHNNLQDLSVRLPLGVLCALTGPSGSGKSTLAEDVVYRAIATKLGVTDIDPPGAHRAIAGMERIKGVVLVDQAPLGRTSRGNPATYTKAWDRIRALFAAEPTAVNASFTASHFSFNVAAGRCDACSGEGYETVEMQFLADVSLLCPACRGKRFKSEVLAIQHRGRSVADVLGMTVDEVLSWLGHDPAIGRSLRPLAMLGLGYLPLGQPLSTLSGGEAQRLKLARSLRGNVDGQLFVLDEPSAGLHPSDVERVVNAMHGLVDRGASVLVVDHDLHVVRAADWVIDLGPGAGREGGQLVAEGTPEHVRTGAGQTAAALRGEIDVERRSARRRKGSVNGTSIHIQHAREHNLREVSCDIPRQRLVVVTGPSGSGKSSLVFDVLFAEGQRRFLETLTPYARQFLPTMPRPDVDTVTGLPPAIALEQRRSRTGANSTVATVTEVAHYLRLLFAKVGTAYCPDCDVPIAALTEDGVLAAIHALGRRGRVYAPVVQARKGLYLDLLTSAHRAGIGKARVDGELVDTDTPPRLRKTKEHDIDLLLYEGPLSSLPREVLRDALTWARGAVRVEVVGRKLEHLMSTKRACPSCGVGIPELDPRWFSFNTRQGRCEACEGTGKEWLDSDEPCEACEGSRLAPIPRAVRLHGARYHEVVAQSVARALRQVGAWTFQGDDALVAKGAYAELVRRIDFLSDVGLDYLGLDRDASTLSGGEMQRLRLSAQLGAGLTGALYVLDEPTIGLHPADTARLLRNLRALVNTGSTVVVVEHDADTIRAADHIVDLGPGGGRGGGRIVSEGTAKSVLGSPTSPTGVALAEHTVCPPPPRPAAGATLSLLGARANNLANIDVDFPVGRLTVVAGVSGSGKSTLVQKTLYPAVRRALRLTTDDPQEHTKLIGAAHVERAASVDQLPIGRTPRSVPATFLGVWDDVRKLFAATPDAKVRGFNATRFSFNSTTGGRCSVCKGMGVLSHEMAFLPDVVTPCDACHGSRFEQATLDITYRGRSVGDVLRMTADEAASFFAAHPKIARPLETLSQLGVGYVQLGQGSHTLSGGEAQRLKLALELTASGRHRPTLYVLDEPTTGLHLTDVAKLVRVLHQLVERGDTLVVIEHHPDVIASADHVVELGPGGGERGGRVVASGRPEDVARAGTATGKAIELLLPKAKRGRRPAGVTARPRPSSNGTRSDRSSRSEVKSPRSRNSRSPRGR